MGASHNFYRRRTLRLRQGDGNERLDCEHEAPHSTRAESICNHAASVVLDCDKISQENHFFQLFRAISSVG